MHTPDTVDTMTAHATATELFGSFMLDNDEFALPAVCIREVVNFPAKLTALPLSPAFLEGMFTLRGSVIPVVNLARVFRAQAAAAEPHHKIAILDYQGVQIGLLVHATGEILRVRPEQRSTLSYAAADQHGVVAGTILLDDGARLIQVLDPAALARIENVPQVLALQGASRQAARQHQGERRRCVGFSVGASRFAFDMSAIQEIIRVPELQASILNSELCLGRINFRGSQVAVVCFHTLLGAQAVATEEHKVDGKADGNADADTNGPAAAPLPDQRIVIARIDDATIGFLVDSVDNILHFFAEEIMPIPLLSKARAGMFLGCVAKPEQAEVIVLDHRQIFSSQEILTMREGHKNLYPNEAAAAAGGQNRVARASQRRVYLTFALEHSYAVEIKQVRELIDCPSSISLPPGLPPFMRGMLNLRQQMISVIDLRRLYGMAPAPSSEQAKLLIIERGEDRYGLLVDAVENIMTVDDKRRFHAPKLMRSTGISDGPRGEMTDVIDIEGEGDSHQTLSVFECDQLLERLAREMPALPSLAN